VYNTDKKGESLNKNLLFAVLIFILFVGCATKERKYKEYENHSSMVDYFYPQKERVAMSFFTTDLKFPIKIAIGFIPSRELYYQRVVEEDLRVKLLEDVKKTFDKFEFISKSIIIPSAFFQKGGGFGDLEKIKKLYDVDFMVLVSLDVINFRADSFNSITYWTIIGGDIIKARGNLSHLMVNCAMVDSQNQKLLFKALGTDRVSNSKMSFQKASAILIKNLTRQLPLFKWRMDEKKK